MSSAASSDKYQQEMDTMALYAEKVDSILKDMLQVLFTEQPSDPLEYMIDYLVSLKKERDGRSDSDSDHAEDDDDFVSDAPLPKSMPAPKPYQGGRRRTAVSAEPVSAMTSGPRERVVHAKSAEQKVNIRDAIVDNILFAALDSNQLEIVVDAMFERKCPAGDSIIKQGEDGDNFYIVSDGECECYVAFNGKPATLVKTYSKGEAFGELALMYNCPRAATVKAKTDVSLWAMDRLTFRQVLMDTTASKRQRYEQFLEGISLLSSLDRYERAKVSDALVERVYEDGEYIIKQGERGDNFYILEEGAARATKSIKGSNQPLEVMRMKPGDYFGELALLNDAPRAANVIAIGRVKVACLDRSSFTRLLGPCEEILSRNMQNYLHYEKQSYENKIAAVRGMDSSSTSDKEDNDDSDTIADLPPAPAGPSRRTVRRRTAVSSEPVSAMSEGLNETIETFPKSTEQKNQILHAIRNNFLFMSLDENQKNLVIDTMKEMTFNAGDSIIKQGENGDYFYVLDQGTCECFVSRGKTEAPLLVKTYEHSESFGELALMYNCPRAATVTAKTPVTVWAMGRVAFRRILMETTASKRSLFESFLESVPLLSSLDRYERAKVADALVECSFAEGEYVIRQGEAGDNFYIVEDGTAIATKQVNPQSAPVQVMQYSKGSYFGELALLSDVGRAANVIATSALKCVKLDRSAFVRLLGPCDEILKRNSDQYKQIESQIKAESS